MTIEEKLRDNLAKLKLHPADFRRLITPNEEQKELTNNNILLNQEEFLVDVLRLRNSVDERFLNDSMIKASLRSREVMYPYGLCRELRDAVLLEMLKRAEDANYPGLRHLGNFIRDGGVVQPFWGIDKGIYFENAIQIGSAILDVANDTVDTRKDPIAFYASLEESTIKPVESFAQFAEVGELYWKQEMFPNFYLPALSPVFPILSVEKSVTPLGLPVCNIKLQTGAGDLHFKNFYTVNDGCYFGLAREFLNNSKKRLPENLLTSLKSSQVLRKLSSLNKGWFEVSDLTSDFHQAFSKFRVNPSNKPTLDQIRLADATQKAGMAINNVALAQAVG